MLKFTAKKLHVAVAVSSAIGCLASNAYAQDTIPSVDSQKETEVIEVRGIRSALASALAEKRSADSIKEVIQAEDIGKLPDQNLAEVLENITGVQIDRTAGVGTGVQIRGTNANRVEINGVSTVGSGNGRSGISFDDLPAALISSLEVIKVPSAETIEGSVGGTINLRTLRGLSLKEQLISVRAQAENSDLAEATSPRVSATFGDSYDTDYGRVGIVLTGSYAEQQVASFDPRFDRDREVLPDSGSGSAEAFPFLRTQFLDQVISRYEYETKNFTGSIEFEPVDDLKFYFDATLNRQERAQKSSRAFISGTGGSAVVDNTNNTAFETVNLGTIDGPNGPLNLGEVQAVLTGTLGVGVDGNNNNIDPNLRTSVNTGSRFTDSDVFATGFTWLRDRLKLSSEVSYSSSDSFFPRLNTTLDFINPNGPQPSEGLSIDNGVPVDFDASDRTLQFGIAQGAEFGPSDQDLLNPANYALRGVGVGRNTQENAETAFRIDADYDISDLNPYFSGIKAGYRWNKNTALSNNVNTASNFSNPNTSFYRPTADLFSDIVSAGPSNFNDADGRRLYIANYLTINGDLSFSDPDAVINALNQAIEDNNALQIANGNITEGYPLLSEPELQLDSFFDIEEETSALYLQGDYFFYINDITFRGNVGLRYVDTEVTSVGNNIENGEVTGLREETSSYEYFLPRFNIVSEVIDDVVIRAGVAKDIRRPNFDNLSTSINFPGGAGSAVRVGNPALTPEEVISYDLSAEYYFSESSFVSVGIFHKERTDIFAAVRDNPEEPIGDNGQIERDITAPCEGGGIYNPTVTDRNVWSSVPGTGICVPLQTTINLPNEETQTGIEFAFQHDLSAYEKDLGWASGFGVIANYTYQESGAGIETFRPATGDANALNKLLGRTDTDQSTATLADDIVEERIELEDLSQNAYNITLFYDKYDLSVRARYTWRSAFKTGELISFDMPRIVDDRAQLNMSVSYDINDTFTVGLDGINLLREDRTEWCVNEGALLCAQGLTDRRIVLGVTANL